MRRHLAPELSFSENSLMKGFWPGYANSKSDTSTTFSSASLAFPIAHLPTETITKIWKMSCILIRCLETNIKHITVSVTLPTQKSLPQNVRERETRIPKIRSCERGLCSSNPPNELPLLNWASLCFVSLHGRVANAKFLPTDRVNFPFWQIWEKQVRVAEIEREPNYFCIVAFWFFVQGCHSHHYRDRRGLRESSGWATWMRGRPRADWIA